MSVVISGKVATLGNYLELTKGYSTDIQDEVRSAILDDTPISPYIKKCKNDSFKLNQIRLAIREYVPSRYISTHLSATNLKWIRKISSKGYSLYVLDNYLSKGGVLSISCDALDLVLSAYYDGVDVASVDFTTVSEDVVGLVCAGLRKGYPMWVITESHTQKSAEFIRVLMKCMSLNLDIHPFLSDGWDVERVQLIASNASRLEYVYAVLMKHINSRFSKEQLEIIIEVAKDYLDFLPLCLKDEDGYPVFNTWQLDAISKVIRFNASQESVDGKEIDIEKFLNPKMSDLDMMCMFNEAKAEIEEEGRRVLSGKLPKGIRSD